MHTLHIQIARQEVKQAAETEKKMLVHTGAIVNNEGLIETTMSYDGMWMKRSYKTGYNSLSGCGTIIGKLTKQIIDYETRNKKCKVCDTAAKNNKPGVYASPWRASMD